MTTYSIIFLNCVGILVFFAINISNMLSPAISEDHNVLLWAVDFHDDCELLNTFGRMTINMGTK
jgi:hypothetical protein